MSAAEMTVAADEECVAAERQDRPKRHDWHKHRSGRGLLFSAVLMLILLCGGWHLLNPGTLPIRQLAIEGEFRHLIPLKLEESVAGVVQGGFFTVNVEAIQETLLLEPWVEQVAVKRVWPDAITVQVQEQTAAARWGEEGLLNAAGRFFAPAAQTIPADLPILYGPPGSELLLMDYLHRLSAMLAGSDLEVAELKLNERRAWVVVLNNGLVIKLGRRKTSERLEYLARYVLAQFKQRLDEMAALDMRYTNGFAVRLKNAPLTMSTGQR